MCAQIAASRVTSAIDSTDLRDRTCVVTGASSGIGRAIAVALGAAGATVCAVARRGDELKVTADRLNGSGRFVLHAVDLVDDDGLDRLSEALLAREAGCGTYYSDLCAARFSWSRNW